MAPVTKAQDEQSETAETKDAVVEALEREKKIAVLEKEIAEAEKAKRAAKLPTTEGSGITGTATFGQGTGYYAEMLAYRSLAEAAAEVVVALLQDPATPQGEILVVAGDDLAKQAQLWEIAQTRLDDANARLIALDDQYPPDYDFAQPEAVAATVTAAAALLGAAADIASFFRSDLTVSARAVTVPPAALLAATAGQLRANGWTPILPSSSLDETKLLKEIGALLSSRRGLAERRRTLEEAVQGDLLKLGNLRVELSTAQAELARVKAATPADAAAVKKAQEAVNAVQAKIVPVAIKEARWQKVAVELDATLMATDALVNALVQGAEGKPSALEAVAAVDVAKSKPTIPILRLEASSQGGEVHVSKGAWTTRLTYVGGVAVSYLLTDHQGAVQKSGVVAQPVVRTTKARDAAAALVLD